jgi:hypothetical protein
MHTDETRIRMSRGGLNLGQGYLISFAYSCIPFLIVFHPCFIRGYFPSPLRLISGIFLLLPISLGAELRLTALSVIATRPETLYKTRLS